MSPWLPCPETWTFSRPGCTTSQPWRKRLPIRWDTTRPFPGMTRADRTTVSPGPTASSRCSPRLTSESAESASPWLPETKTSARLPASLWIWPGVSWAASGTRRDRGPSRCPRCPPSDVRRTRLGVSRDARRRPRAAIRGIEVAKQETSTLPGVRATMSSKAGITSVFAAGDAGHLDVGAVGEERQDTAVPPRRDRLEIGPLLGRRGRVDLEIAACENDACRGLDSEGEAVDDAVSDSDRVDRGTVRSPRPCPGPACAGRPRAPGPRGVCERSRASADSRRRARLRPATRERAPRCGPRVRG